MLATQVYLIMYVLMFIAAIRLCLASGTLSRLPSPGTVLLYLLSNISSNAALVISFVHTAQFSHLKTIMYKIEIIRI